MKVLNLEVGAPPIKTDEGWLLLYSYIQNYFSSDKVFGIEAVLLDLEDPFKVIWRTTQPLLRPKQDYELNGDVPDVTFPSGGLLDGGKIYLYYGGADTTCCCAKIEMNQLLNAIKQPEKIAFFPSKSIPNEFERLMDNPIIAPRPEFSWEAKATFNPAAIYESGQIHIIYRAMSYDDTSVFGYATSRDGIHIDERLPYPIYIPRENFENKLRPGNSGCEDPRITKMDNRFYLFYTAYDGYSPRVAYTSILIENFLNKKWNWEPAQVITPPGIPDKNACLLPKKINDQYVIFHRAGNTICINYVDTLSFDSNRFLVRQSTIIRPRKTKVPIRKVGISAPPIEIDEGWLLLYHWVDEPTGAYKIGAALLDFNNPTVVISSKDTLLLSPQMDYEKEGYTSNVVFPCGAVLLDPVPAVDKEHDRAPVLDYFRQE